MKTIITGLIIVILGVSCAKRLEYMNKTHHTRACNESTNTEYTSKD